MRKLSMEELGRMTTEEFVRSKKMPVTVVLDNIRSLNNIGSIFRTADAFRVESIHLCGITGRPPHREIHKTALGATESVNWEYFEDTADSIRVLRDAGYRIVVIEQTDESLRLDVHDLLPDIKTAVVFGNEVKGVQQSVVDMADLSIEIPQMGTKHSLNVSVSAGIILWSMFRNMVWEKINDA